MSALYFTNSTEDFQFETLANWNTAQDGSGDTPTNVPWTDDDGNGGAWYADYDLLDATGGAISLYPGITVSSTIDPNGVVTGTCDFPVNFGANVYGGNFSNSTIAWSGNNIIYGGSFSGGYNLTSATIYGGGFSGTNSALDSCTVHGGVFSGTVIVLGGWFDGGDFTGVSVFELDNSGYYNSTITGGTFNLGVFVSYGFTTISYFGETLLISNSGPSTGGYNYQHYTDGTQDTFSGVDYDFYVSEPRVYVNGYSQSYAVGGWAGNHYAGDGIDTFSGVDFDYADGLYYYFNYGTTQGAGPYSGVWNGLSYAAGVLDNTFTGPAIDWGAGTLAYNFVDGVAAGLFTGGLSGVYYVDGSGPYWDTFYTGVGIEFTDGLVYNWDNGVSTGLFNGTFNGQNYVDGVLSTASPYPDPSDVRSGVVYGPSSNLIGTLQPGTPGSRLNIAQLLGLPPFIQL